MRVISMWKRRLLQIVLFPCGNGQHEAHAFAFVLFISVWKQEYLSDERVSVWKVTKALRPDHQCP